MTVPVLGYYICVSSDSDVAGEVVIWHVAGKECYVDELGGTHI